MVTTRRVYKMARAGNLKRLRIREESINGPNEGEVLVKIKHIGLNFADIACIWGLYKAAPKTDFVPGLEYSGEIVSIGRGVTDMKPGDRVMGITRFGGYTDYLNTDARYLVRIPEEWDDAQGAAYLVQVLTAWYGLVVLGQIDRDHAVLIHSGAGGVGIKANRIAKAMGAFTIGSVGRAEKIALLEKEGYDRGIVRSKHFKDDLRKALDGRPLRIVMECIGGRILKEGFGMMGAEGRMIVYGSASFISSGNRPNYFKILWKYLLRPKIDPMILPNENKSLLGFNLIWLYPQVERMHRILNAIEDLHLPPPIIGHRFPFEALPDAIRLLQSGKTTGKVVVRTGH